MKQLLSTILVWIPLIFWIATILVLLHFLSCPKALSGQG